MKEKCPSCYTCTTAVHAGRKKRIGFILAGLVVILGVCIGIGWNQRHKDDFIPPSFDQSAVAGLPNPPADLGYMKLTVEQGYEIALCGRLFGGDKEIPIYATNPSGNKVWFMVQILDGEEIVAQTGLIKPGEYVERIGMKKAPQQKETDVKVKITAFEPETYISKGNAVITTKLYKEIFQDVDS